MKIFNTADLNEQSLARFTPDEASWIYNGLDCCVTAEIYNELAEQLRSEPPEVQATYAFCLRKQAPIFEASLRGTLIDKRALQSTLDGFRRNLAELNSRFQRIMVGVFGHELNWRSPVQLKTLFYGELGLKEVKKRNANGLYVATVNREALESFRFYLHAAPLANFILAMRDVGKAISFLESELDPDGRIRTTYNLAGTNTGRLSSSMNDFGSGTNLQNVNRKLRFPFVPDPGMYLVNIDLEQADSRGVGARCWKLFHESHGPEFAGAYLNACESGDLHTFVCRMAWSDLDWPEDMALWRPIADRNAYRDKSYRDLAKALGHGTNYYGTPPTMAKHTHTEASLIKTFQLRYFRAFPCIPAWQEWVINEIKTHGVLYNLFGRRRMFFGRGNDASTHRKAIAYDPQSTTGEFIDRGWVQVYEAFSRSEVQFLGQVHDSLLFQVPFDGHAELIPQILEKMQVHLDIGGGRSFTIPLEAKTGWNWGDFDKRNPGLNPYGLRGWKGVAEDRPRPFYKGKPKSFREKHLRG